MTNWVKAKYLRLFLYQPKYFLKYQNKANQLQITSYSCNSTNAYPKQLQFCKKKDVVCFFFQTAIKTLKFIKHKADAP